MWLQWIRQRQPQDSTIIFYVLGFGASYIRDLTVCIYKLALSGCEISSNEHSSVYNYIHADDNKARLPCLSHWGRVTHICVSKLTSIGSDNGLSPCRRQAIMWTNAGILLIRTIWTNVSEILSEIRASSFKKMDLKMSSAKWRPFCLGLNVLYLPTGNHYIIIVTS